MYPYVKLAYYNLCKLMEKWMQKITIKAYAVKHKLSIFNVMKMVKSKKLKSVSVEENGKEQIYICIDDALEEEIQKGIVPNDQKDTKTLNEEVRLLKIEVAKLKEQIQILSQKLL